VAFGSGGRVESQPNAADPGKMGSAVLRHGRSRSVSCGRLFLCALQFLASFHCSYVNAEAVRRVPIDTSPSELITDIAAAVRATLPSAQQLAAARGQLLAAGCAAPGETVIESFYRCVLTEHLQQQFRLTVAELPSCIHSSHKGPARVCVGTPAHAHNDIVGWVREWRRFRDNHEEVDIRDPRLRRADLFVVARGRVVSVEFKYVGRAKWSDPSGACVEQMQRYAQYHAATILVVYCGGVAERNVRGLFQLRQELGPDIPLVVVEGPAVLQQS
jgi:hypothetical protein